MSEIRREAIADIDHRSGQPLFTQNDPPADARLRSQMAEEKRLNHISLGSLSIVMKTGRYRSGFQLLPPTACFLPTGGALPDSRATATGSHFDQLQSGRGAAKIAGHKNLVPGLRG